MAEEVVHHPVDQSCSEGTETTDRGLFDFLGSKKEEDQKQEEVIVSEFEQKVHVSEPEPKYEQVEEEKKPSLLEKLHRSGSSSSSSVSLFLHFHALLFIDLVIDMFVWLCLHLINKKRKYISTITHDAC